MAEKEFALMTFDNLAGGALPERLTRAMGDLIANYRDVNTDPEGVREITIKLRFVGNEKRDKLPVKAKIEVKLPGMLHVEDIVYLGRDAEGRVGAYTFDPGQLDMLNEAQANILPLSPPAATGARS
jgi:hypothetical protein